MKKGKLLVRRQMQKTKQQDLVLGVCWYTPREWERMKATATDPDRFEDSFSEWEAMANENLTLIRTAYPNAVKVFVAADDFHAWCFLRGKANDSDARAEFVSETLRVRGANKQGEQNSPN